MIQAGELRRNILIKRKSMVKDEFGGNKESWYNHLSLRANVKYITGGENIDGKEIFNNVKIQYTTYYRDIKETDRILYNNKEYNILSINEIGFKAGLEIIADLINN